MIVRQFRESGIDEFRKFLAQCRAEPRTPLPLDLLEDNAHTETVAPRMTVEPQHFESRRKAAEYLRGVLEPLPVAVVANNAGLWTWLSLFYFDELCPPLKGKREPTNDYSYVFEPKNMRHFYRHLLFIGWRILHLASKHNRMFLDVPLASLDKVTSEVMKRLYLTRIRYIFEVLDRIYWDDSRSRVRSGVVSPGAVKPGDLMHRFPIRVRQLEKTYDLQSLNADLLIELLGNEFQFSANGAVPQRTGREKAKRELKGRAGKPQA